MGVVQKKLPKGGSRNIPSRTSARSSGYCASTVVFRFHRKTDLVTCLNSQIHVGPKTSITSQIQCQIDQLLHYFSKPNRKPQRFDTSEVIQRECYSNNSRDQAESPKGNRQKGHRSYYCTRSSLYIPVGLTLTDLVVSTDLAYKFRPQKTFLKQTLLSRFSLLLAESQDSNIEMC